MKKWGSAAFLVICAVFHVAMLVNLAAHFQWESLTPPRWSPVRTGSESPPHWSHSRSIPPVWNRFEDTGFAAKLRAEKKREIMSRPLMGVPRRATDNFGLDHWIRDATRTDPGGDFFQLYQSGIDVRRNASIYENDPPGQVQDSRAEYRRTVPFHPPNRYPPAFAFTAGVLLSLAAPWDAYLAWTILHELVLLLCILLTWRLCRVFPGSFAVCTGLWLGFFPWYLELYMGQTTFLIMAGSFVLGSHFLGRSGTLNATVWWTLTLITKPLTLLYTPLLIIHRKWRILLPGLSVGLGSAAVYFLFRPADGRLFVNWALGQEMVFSLGNNCFQNLVYHFLFSDRTVRLLSYGLLAAGLVLTLLYGLKKPVQVLCLWICIYFLSYAHVWQHHQVLLLPAIILPYLLTRRTRVIVPWLLATLPSPFYFFEGHWNWFREVIYLSMGSLPVVWLTVLTIHWVVRSSGTRNTTGGERETA